MFIKIKEQRLKVSSIGEYGPGYSLSMDSHFLRIKVSNKERIIYTGSKKELSKLLTYLDKALKVSEV